MLTLFEGGFYSALNDELIFAIKGAINRGRRVYLIVPEQETVNAEFEMSERLPESAPLSFEVTNFTRFTNTAFREIGGISGEYCSPAKKALVMWRVLSELSPMLSLTRGRKNVSEGSVKKALSAIKEMQTLGITPEVLEALPLGEIHDRRLGEKIKDLSLIYSLYKSSFGEKYSDNTNDASALAEMLTENADFLSGTEIFVSGFTSFTEPQNRLLGAIMASVPLTVALTIGRVYDYFEYAEVAKTRAKLLALADGAGVEKRLKRFGAVLSSTTLLGEICELLWRNDGYIDNDSLHNLTVNREMLQIYSAETMYDECDFIAADIKRRVMAGARFSDFAIVARGTDSYLGIIDSILDEAKIPYFISKVSDISSIPLFKLIYTAYKIAERGFKAEDVMTYLKCGLLSVTRDEADRFELYIEKWQIDGRRFTDGVSWTMSPRGYEALREGDAELLGEIDATRVRVIDPLVDFRDEISEAETVREHADALLKLLARLEIEEIMAKRTEELSLLGEAELAEENRRAWGALCDALDDVVEVIGDLRADSESFIAQLKTALSGAAVGHIPTLTDAVTIGSADMLRVKDKRHVYLIGVNAGEFPASVSESSYFADSEKLMLGSLGLPIEPDLEIMSAREFYSFSRAFSIGRESVTLLYTERTAMLSPQLPSDVIARISEITRGAVSAVKVKNIKKSNLLYTESATLEALSELTEDEARAARQALRLSGYTDKLIIRDGNIKNNHLSVSDDALGLIYKRDLYLSQTRIDKFLGCPMSYFCRYNLRLAENEPAELGSNIIGSFVHATIESFFGELEERGISAAELTAADRERITERAAEKYAGELIGETGASARAKATISRLVRATKPVIDGLCEELSGALYKPTFFELETSSLDDASPNHVIIDREDGGRIIVRGTIDRVDTYKSGDDVYVRVIDYKTGHTDFLPSKLKDGEYLQMFLYLKAIKDTDSRGFRERLGVGDGGRIIPAGVIYVKTRVSDTTVRRADDTEAEAAVKKLQERDGMLLDEPVSIDAMNPDFIPPEAKKKEPLRYTEEGWDEIERTLIEVTRGVADSMCSGKIDATPATKGGRNCKWCRYKEV